MKLLSLAICSLGIMFLLGAFISGSWVQIVFGAITAVLALGAVDSSQITSFFNTGCPGYSFTP